ncbi:septation protein SepH [Flexivirga caeni]|uniref:DUF3071 domain-containing protein n=1 Tax=Flexivirga caeni TaxID=2294115 RepID=A0A3M9LYJ6_9MICO|nr:septation protein SepH [Flexivirga caeni]RNI18370.1 DUF3071 domain-containing protein [Flexivirga caeni]
MQRITGYLGDTHMRELRLIGVDDDGGHLLLAEGDTETADLRLPIDDSLRAALRPARQRPSTDVGSIPVPDELRPRDVQALLRAGVSVDDVAERADWTTEKVLRYEGPIRAERDHIADLARQLAVGGSGRADSTFGQRVERRLDGRGVAADDIVWDAWRGHDGTWTVICGFPAGGRQRQAAWHFDVRGRILDAVDDEARWLGEDENSPGALSDRRSARDVSVYDVEAEGGLDAKPTTPVRRVRGGRTSATAIPTHPAGSALPPTDPAQRPVDLVAAMRERSKSRGRKGRAKAEPVFPADAAPQEHLDTSGAAPPLGSHPRPEELAEQAPAAQPAKPSVDELGHDPVTGTADLFADLEPEPAAAAAPEPDPEAAAEPDTEPEPAVPDRPATARKGRPSVPSWDDIMFGRRPGNN